MSTPSQTRTRAGSGALFLTLFAIVWDGVVIQMLLPQDHAPVWFKAVFVLAGVAVTAGALYAWRQRLQGGGATLALSRDPVPHGVPVSATFEIDRAINATEWLVEARVESRAGSQSSFGVLWSQDYRANPLGSQRVSAEVTLPADVPSTVASDGDTRYRVTLTLKANHLAWTFDLQTRTATASETMFGTRDARSLGNKVPTYTPEQAVAMRKRLRPWLVGLVALGIGLQLITFFDVDLWPRAKVLANAGTYSTAVTTPEFEVRVTNYLINDWALRGRLIAKARVVDGVLMARVESLSVQPVGACTSDSRICEIESVSLLLSRDGKGSFETLAQSDAIPVQADLRQVTRWTLPADRAGTEIRMPLPAGIDTDGIRLKLEIRATSGATVYPHHGPRLTLQRALAAASARPDPCERIKAKMEMVRDGCTEHLQRALQGQHTLGATLAETWGSVRERADAVAASVGLGAPQPAAGDTPDELLLEALRTENFSVVPVLLAAGASPNAHSASDKGRTALGYAAASNDVAMVERLLKAGAQASTRHANEQGQIVTPLTQALRTNASAAIRRLLQAGAATHTNDPTGWTPMHIAAYESATQSLVELVKAGADVNERTPAYRQHTPLQTALQFGDIHTVRALLELGADRSLQDNQGKDACAWAEFFKRPEDIRALVCL